MDRKGFTLVELIAIIIIISVIAIMSFSAITRSLKQAEERNIKIFEDSLVNAAEVYIDTNRDKVSNFTNINDTTCIGAIELINLEYLSPDITPPKGRAFSDYVINAVIKSDYAVEYTVRRGTC